MLKVVHTKVLGSFRSDVEEGQCCRGQGTAVPDLGLSHTVSSEGHRQPFLALRCYFMQGSRIGNRLQDPIAPAATQFSSWASLMDRSSFPWSGGGLPL